MPSRLFLTIIFLMTTRLLIAQEKKVSRGNQQWLQYYNEIKLNKKWTWLTDGGYRWKDGFKEGSQYIIRTGAGYAITPDIRISTGFAYLGFYAGSRINKVEFRPYQELSLKNNSNKVSLHHRFRVEERFFNPVLNGKIQTSNTFNFRFRYAFMTGIPLFHLSKTNPDRMVLLNLGDEIFINAGKDIVYNVFDQNRVIVSPTLRLSKNLSFSLTWNSQFAATSTPATYTYTNVFWLQVKHTLEARHRK